MLIIGGRFATINSVIVNNIAQYHNGSWMTFSNGLEDVNILSINYNVVYNTIIVDGIQQTTSTVHQLKQWSVRVSHLFHNGVHMLTCKYKGNLI